MLQLHGAQQLDAKLCLNSNSSITIVALHALNTIACDANVSTITE